MGFGKKVRDFFHGVGEAVFGVKKIPSKLKRKPRRKEATREPSRKVPAVLSGFFERRHAGWSEYVMLKAQLAIVASFVAAVIYTVLLPDREVIFIAALLVLSAYALYLIPTQFKRAFERDYPAYRSFVIMCVAIVWVFVLALRYLPVKFSYDSPYLVLLPPLVTIGFVLLAFLFFRVKYGRSFTYGTVESVRGKVAAVRVGYDICSNVKSGLYFVESFVKVKKGDLVKVGVERPMLGLRGAKVRAILVKIR